MPRSAIAVAGLALFVGSCHAQILQLEKPGEVSLTGGGYFQFRYNASIRDHSAPGAQDIASGAHHRRAKLWLRHRAMDGRVRSYALTAFNRGTGRMFIENMYLDYDITGNEDWLRIGQFKPPLLREETLGAPRQLAAERSNTNRAFTQGFSQGLQFIANGDEHLTWTVSISDGLGQINTAAGTEDADIAFTGRIDVFPQRQKRRFRDFTSFRGSDLISTFGAAAHFETGGATIGTEDMDLLTWTADGSVEGDGWNAYGAVIGRYTNETLGSFYDTGVIAQGGCFVADDVEVFGRYDVLIPDSGRETNETFHTLTAGSTWFLVPESHALKITGDVGVTFGDQSESIAPATDATGLLSADGDTQVILRLQILVVF
ncbi:MAG: hypothetical protein AAGB51_13480 [Planctomycetota bacterium]